MSDRSAAAATLNEEPVAPPTSGLVAWLLSPRRTARALALVWGAVFLFLTQIPQRRATIWQPDGITRGDADLFTALSLDDLGASVLVWLACTLTVVLSLASLRSVTRLDRRLALAASLLVLGAIASGAAWSVAALAPPPVVYEVPMQGFGAVALSVEDGRLERTDAPVLRCTGSTSALDCQFDGAPVALRPGETSAVADGQLLWLGVATLPNAATGRLEIPDATAAWVGFAVDGTRATLVPALQRRVALVGTVRAGPIVSSAREGDTTIAFASALPVAPDQPVMGRLREAGLARVIWTRDMAGPWALAALVASMLGLLALAFAPDARGTESADA